MNTQQTHSKGNIFFSKLYAQYTSHKCRGMYNTANFIVTQALSVTCRQT